MAKNKNQQNRKDSSSSIKKHKKESNTHSPKKGDNKSKSDGRKSHQNNEKTSATSKKIDYVLNPKALRRKIQEVKESEQKAREKSFQIKKRKRNSIYMKTNSKGQPKLNGRMKLLYDQISRNYGNE